MDRQAITTFEEAAGYLYHIPRFTSKNTIEDTRRHLEKLGSPDRSVRHIIHVAGTNGKGSVCAYLRYILEAAGYSTALFTSPHLVDIRERFLIRGEMVGKKMFLRAFLRVYDSLDWDQLRRGEGYHPTFFEYLFLMGMLLFAEADVDYCILETGLGGRLDATNAVCHKDISVITRISLDHVEYLGDTVEKIAWEKAGIFHEGAPALCLDSGDAVGEVFRKRAGELGIPIYFMSNCNYTFLNFQDKTIDFSVNLKYYDYIRFTIRTQARYQMENAALAARAVELLDKGKTVSAVQMQQGVYTCFWAGRMEEILPDVYVDGAHNADGIRAFLETVREDGCGSGRKLIFGVVKDKDYPTMLQEIQHSGLFTEIAVTQMRTPRAVPLEALKELFIHSMEQEGILQSCNILWYKNPHTALKELLASRREGERIYIAGSLYLVGEMKEESIDHD